MDKKIIRCPIVRRGRGGNWRTTPCGGLLRFQELGRPRYVCMGCLCIFDTAIVAWLTDRLGAMRAAA